MKRIVSLLLIMVLSFSFVSEMKLWLVSAESVENESLEIINSNSLAVSVINHTEIRVNEEKTSYAGLSLEEKYVFTPEVSAIYRFSVSTYTGMVQQAPVITYLYDKDYNLITSNLNWSCDSTLNCEMKKGECYYLEWKSYDGDVVGHATTIVKLVGVPDYNDGVEINSTDELKQVGEEIALEDIKEIKSDEEKQIDITYYGAQSIHEFTPTEDGEYKFTVTGNDMAFINVLDDNFNTIYAAKKNPFSVKLKAGQTYIINSYISSQAYSGLGQYNIEINKLPKAEALTITNGDKIVGHIGYTEALNVAYTPAECATESFEWISSDESVVEVNAGIISLKNTGTAIITVKSENGLEDTIEVECIHYPEIKSDTDNILTIFENATTFTFIPEVSGLYNFSMRTDNAKDEIMPLKLEIAKVKQKAELSIACNTFIDLQYQFKAGEIYYITIENTSGDILGITDCTLKLQSELYCMGDVNRDGIINADDALCVLKAAAKLNEFMAEEKSLADYNEDGVINAEDALKILKSAAKISK